MKLLWIRYETKQRQQYGLFLSIGENNNGIIVLKSKAMDRADIRKIRANLNTLSAAKPSERMAWLKKFCPVSYQKAFRRFSSGKYQIISEHHPKSFRVA